MVNKFTDIVPKRRRNDWGKNAKDSAEPFQTKRDRVINMAVRDAIDDLEDYCTDSKTCEITSPTAKKAIRYIRDAFFGIPEADGTNDVELAYKALLSLKKCNSYTFGEDIPINHAKVVPDFQSVLEILEVALEQLASEKGSKYGNLPTKKRGA